MVAVTCAKRQGSKKEGKLPRIKTKGLCCKQLGLPNKKKQQQQQQLSLDMARTLASIKLLKTHKSPWHSHLVFSALRSEWRGDLESVYITFIPRPAWISTVTKELAPRSSSAISQHLMEVRLEMTKTLGKLPTSLRLGNGREGKVYGWHKSRWMCGYITVIFFPDGDHSKSPFCQWECCSASQSWSSLFHSCVQLD